MNSPHSKYILSFTTSIYDQICDTLLGQFTWHAFAIDIDRIMSKKEGYSRPQQRKARIEKMCYFKHRQFSGPKSHEHIRNCTYNLGYFAFGAFKLKGLCPTIYMA
ncbi:hypothetical protein SAY86_012020 [Trapa natans]|uniref:Uncharacterized protein n=1 Tax=Trapa natans TaxID=22666 RepID=A0AAN7RB74_TRANT|nr:hypothetical protein SAY86_012020 [Trapa natans]